MASSMPTLDQTPPQPPEISGQMGQSPYGGVSAMMQQKDQGAGGQAHPQGALIAQSDAVKKVIDQMAKMEPGFGPFADRIKSLLDAGMGAVVSSGGSPGQGSAPPGGVMGPNSMRPGPPGAGFPG